MQPFFESYSEAYKTLHEGKTITCAATKVAYDPVGAPIAVVIDVCVFQSLHKVLILTCPVPPQLFLSPVMFATRALTGASVPIVCFATGSALSIIRLYGPETLGGLGDFTAKVAAEAEQSGETPDEAGSKVCLFSSSKFLSDTELFCVFSCIGVRRGR